VETTELTERSRAILEAIAHGHAYEQILVQDLTLTYHDIFQAAVEALDVAKAERGGKSYDERMKEIRQAHPRAYEKWSAEEDDRLSQLSQSRKPVSEIANVLQRQPSAIRSRLAKLSLLAAGGTDERGMRSCATGSASAPAG
jgi:uncharacterized protein YciW